MCNNLFANRKDVEIHVVTEHGSESLDCHDDKSRTFSDDHPTKKVILINSLIFCFQKFSKMPPAKKAKEKAPPPVESQEENTDDVNTPQDVEMEDDDDEEEGGIRIGKNLYSILFMRNLFMYFSILL